MRRLLAFVLLLCCLCLLPGCLFSDVTTFLDTDQDRTAVADKVGESSSYSILWLVAWGDSGTQAAARNGGLTTIMNADTRVLNILWGAFLRQTTVVYGE